MRKSAINSERLFLAKLLPRLNQGHTHSFLVPPGDDAAVLNSPARPVLSIDGLTEGVHFKSSWSARLRRGQPISLGEGLGEKALGAALSDLAAMGNVRRRWAMVFLGTPDLQNQKFLFDLQSGFKKAASKYECVLAGGDTVRSKVLTIVVAVGGELQGRPLTRAGTRVGDAVCLTGVVGDASVGLRILSHDPKFSGVKNKSYFIKHFFQHRPLFIEGKTLASCAGVHAMLDGSDSLHETIQLLLKNTPGSLDVDLNRIPTSAEFKKTVPAGPLLLNNGEDYGLLFSADPACLPELKKKINFSVLGTLTKGGSGLRYFLNGKRLPDPKSFHHFN